MGCHLFSARPLVTRTNADVLSVECLKKNKAEVGSNTFTKTIAVEKAYTNVTVKSLI